MTNIMRALIATAGGGSETYWASSVRITTTLVGGQAIGDATNTACQFGAGGEIIQCISSNSEGNAETHFSAYIVRLDPTDGSLIGTKRYRETASGNKSHRFRQDCPAFYHPTMGKVIARIREWWDGSANFEEGAAVINSGGTTDTVLNNVKDNPTAGDGNYLVCYVNDDATMSFYNPSTGAVSAGEEQQYASITAFSLWTYPDSSALVLSGRYSSSSQRIIKISQSSSGFGAITSVRDLPPLSSSTAFDNNNSNRSKLMDSSGTIYGFSEFSSCTFFQVYGTSLENYKQIKYQSQSSYNSIGVSTKVYRSSMVLVGDSVYQSIPIIFRKVGDSQNSVMYPIFQISTSTFQVTACLGVMSDAGAEYADSYAGVLESNAEETCLYFAYIHNFDQSRGGESDKVLKLPLDLTTIPNQNLNFNSTHDDIYLWDFWSATTGGAYPVYSELLQTITYTGATATTSRTATAGTTGSTTPVKVTGNSPASRTLLSEDVEITTT